MVVAFFSMSYEKEILELYEEKRIIHKSMEATVDIYKEVRASDIITKMLTGSSQFNEEFKKVEKMWRRTREQKISCQPR